MFHKWVVKMFKNIYILVIQRRWPSVWSRTNAKYYTCFTALYCVCTAITVDALLGAWKLICVKTTFGLIIHTTLAITPATTLCVAAGLAAVVTAAWFICIFALAGVITFESRRERLRWVYIMTCAVFLAIHVGGPVFAHFYPGCVNFVVARAVNLVYAIFKVTRVRTQRSCFFWRDRGGVMWVRIYTMRYSATCRWFTCEWTARSNNFQMGLTLNFPIMRKSYKLYIKWHGGQK